jgi:hypothetical protein
MICLDLKHPIYSNESRQVVDEFMNCHKTKADEIFDPKSIKKEEERLIAEGLDISENVWEEIFAFSRGIYAPSFEGSTQDAGDDLTN